MNRNLEPRDALSLFAPTPLNQDRFPLDRNERRILEALAPHQGEANAIKCRDLSALVGIPERPLREMISLLRLDHGAKIGMGSNGYFMIKTAEEMNKTNHNLRSRALRLLAIVARQEKRHLGELLGQLRLEVEENEGPATNSSD